MLALRLNMRDKLGSIPSPHEDPDAWFKLVRGYPQQWNVLDQSFSCPDCGRILATQNGLAAKRRLQHSHKEWTRARVSDGRCPVGQRN